MYHALLSFFSWPDGSVWGNMVADIAFGIPAWIIAMWRFEKRHKRHMAETRVAMHNQLQQTMEANGHWPAKVEDYSS